MSDFLDLQGAKDLNTDAIHIWAVANSKDPVTGATIDTHVNRAGGTDYTFKGMLGTLGPVVVSWTFTTGGTLNYPNEAALNPADGNYYGWTGAFPHVVAPGTNPTAVAGYVPRTDVVLRGELETNETLDSLRKIDNLVQSKPSISHAISSAPVWLLNTSSNYATQHALFLDKNSRKGVLQEISDTYHSGTDSSNIGGDSCTRMSIAYVIKEALVGQFNPFAKSAGVTASGSTYVSQANWEAAVGMISGYGGLGYYRNSLNGFQNHITWRLPVGGTVEFYATTDSELIFWSASYLSSAVKIYTDAAEEGVYALVDTITTVAGTAAALKYHVSAKTKVKIENAHPGSAYVYILGCDVSSIFDADLTKTYDSLIYYRESNYTDAGVAYWIGKSTGANDIAMRPVGGRLFGSFHGGHSAETVASYVDGEAVDVTTSLTFTYGNEINVVSESKLNSDTTEYDFKLSMVIGHGFEYTGLSIKPTVSASSEKLEELFTCMTIANKRFDKILRPEQHTISATVGTEYVLGNTGSVVQYDSTRKHKIRTDFTTFNMFGATKKGPYIQTRDGDNKLYYNPSEDGSSYFTNLHTEIVRYFEVD